MKKRTASLIRLLCMVLCIGMMLTGCRLTGCTNNSASSGSGSGSGSSGAGDVTYTVEIVSEGSMPISDVGVWVYTDETKADLVWYEQTNAEGKMSFAGAEGGSYVAVLENVPEGYTVEEYYTITELETKIVLSGSMLSMDDVENVVYNLGDMMYDFTITTPDGTSYTLSQLLEEKEAVVLNFWYGNCAPCKREFPFLQAAYEKYSDRIEVLAMNPVDTDPAIVAEIAESLGLTFPMALVGAEWEQMFQIVGYPTTVIVDRYGMISFIHTGSVTTEGVFEAVFEHFTADDYEQSVVEDITEIVGDIDVNAGSVEGTEDDPIQIATTTEDGGTTMTVDVAAGSITYLEIYKLNNVYATINDDDAYFIYNGKTYEASDGKVTVWLSTEDTFSGIDLGVGNSGDEDKTFTIKFTAKKGSYGNPYALSMGEFTTNVSAGNENGVYYTWTASEDGVLTIQNVSCTSGVDYSYTLYNLNTYAYRIMSSESTGDSANGKDLSVNVHKGDKVQVIVATLPDAKFNYPAATIKSLVAFVAGELKEEEKEPTYTYGVTVTNETGAAVAGVAFQYELNGETLSVATNMEGKAEVVLPEGDYTFTMVVPAHYTASQTTFVLTKDAPTATAQLIPVLSVDYVLTVKDDDGAAVEGVTIIVGNSFAKTDASGRVVFNLPEGGCSGTISVPAGYECDTTAFAFEGETTELTVSMKKLHDLVVTVMGDDALPVSGAEVTVNGTSVVADESGQAAFCLSKGTYEVTISELEGYVSDASYTAVVESGSNTVSVELKKLYEHVIAVEDQNGAKIPGVEVIVDGMSYTTDAEGAIVIERVRGQYAAVVAAVPVGSDESAVGAEYVLDTQTGTLVITVESVKMPYTVKTVDEDGNAVAGATVTVNGEKMITGEDGVAAFEHYVGSYTASIIVPSGYYAEQAEYAFEDGAYELTIRLLKMAEFTVTVMEEESSDLISGVVLEVWVSEVSDLNFQPVQAITADGVVTFTLPRCGEYLVTVIAVPDGYAFTSSDHSFDADNKMTILLDRRNNYTVSVEDDLGAAVSGVSVSFLGDDETVSTKTGNSGSANFAAYDGVSATITVPEGYRLADGESATKEFGQTTALTYKLQKIETYTVSVADQNGAMDGVTVTIDGVEYTTEQGKVEVALDRGEHTAAVTVPEGYQAVGESVKTFDGATELSFRLQQVKTYTVTVSDDDGPMDGVTVTVGTASGVTENGKVSFTLPVADYTAVITVPDGYTADSGSVAFGTGTAVSVKLERVAPTLATYSVNLLDAATGKAVDTECLVIFSQNGAQKYVVEAVKGVAKAELEIGTYDVTLYMGADYYTAQTSFRLTETDSSMNALVAKVYSGEVVEHWYANMYPLEEGGVYVDLTSGGTTFFSFTPTRSGVYKVQVYSPLTDAYVCYYGSATYPVRSDRTEADNSFTIEIELGPTIVIGVEAAGGVTNCIISVTYEGEIVKAERVEYDDTKYSPVDYTLASGKTLSTINLRTTTTSDLVLGSDGYYYLNGKLVMVDFNWSTLSLSAMAYVAGILRYFDTDGDGVYDLIEEYTGNMRGYIGYVTGKDNDGNLTGTTHYYTDSAGEKRSVYPLNPELMYMLQNTCAHQGWADPDSPNYLDYYDTYSGMKVEDGWMAFLVVAG